MLDLLKENEIVGTEMDKLENLLNNTNANFERTTSDIGFDQIVLCDEDGEKLDDVIFGFGSHGYDKGLLETFSLGGCDGYETAEQVFNGWKNLFPKAFE